VSSQPPHILIVDDEKSILEVFRTLFKNDGYRMTFCTSGREALSILQNKDVDIVISDKNLLDISGLEVIKAAKEIRPETEAIIITGYASLDTALYAMELDAFDYMLKPLHNIFDIKNKVRKALQKQAMTLENRRLLQHLKEYSQELENALEERKRVEAELIQSEKLAGIGTLASGIAHEISSPLFGVLGLAEAILDEEDIGLIKEYAGEIVDYAKQIREIVQELSAYSRTASVDGVAEVNLEKICGEALRMVERTRSSFPGRRRVEIEEGLAIHARPNEIKQLFVNLIKNAIDALESDCPPDPLIEIVGYSEDTHAIIEVRDNGPGIPPERLHKIFDPFFTTKEVGKGTGLGLHIVHRIVSKYHGTISATNRQGGGTVFTIRFAHRVL